MTEAASTPPPAGTPGRWAPVDMLLAALPVGFALFLWLVGRGPDSTARPPDAPFWARFRDYLLDGPDAGMWAANAYALASGRAADLDGHRLPVFPRLTALLMGPDGDVALAGHLVAHLSHVGVGAVVYLLGARWMSRGMALGAALAAVFYIPALDASERFGVDPLVALALALALLAAEVASVSRWAALPAGLLAGGLAATHLTTLGVPVAAVALCLFRTPGRVGRLFTTVLFACGAAVGLRAMFHGYPVLPWEVLVGTLSEGVQHGAQAGGPGGSGAPGGSMVSLDVVLSGLPHALERLVAYASASARPGWFPWYPSLVLPWLGLVGALRGEGSVAARVGRGLGIGVPLALALAPPLAFAAADAPERYTENFHALVLLLMFRGLDVGVWGIERLAAHRWTARWVSPAIAGAAGLLASAGLWPGVLVRTTLSKPPTPEDTNAWRLGTLLRAHFPPGGGLACTNREAIAYAGRVYCPTSTGQRFWHDKDPARAWLAAECPGEGDIPYVVYVGQRDERNPARKDLDAWVQANGRAVTELHLPGMEAWVYAVAR